RIAHWLSRFHSPPRPPHPLQQAAASPLSLHLADPTDPIGPARHPRHPHPLGRRVRLARLSPAPPLSAKSSARRHPHRADLGRIALSRQPPRLQLSRSSHTCP